MSLVRKCCIGTCSSRFDNGKGMHAFPSNPELRVVWQNLCKIEKVTSSTRICRNHFKDNDYQLFSYDVENKRLISGAVPSKFLPENLDITVNPTADLSLGSDLTLGISRTEGSLIPDATTINSKTLITCFDSGHNYVSCVFNNT